MDEYPNPIRDPVCPICKAVLFGRVIWFQKIGNCHDTCVAQLVEDEIAAAAITGDNAAA